MTPSNDNRPAEFDVMILTWLEGIRGYSAALTKGHGDDLAQATVLKAMERWTEYRPGPSPMGWLKKLAKGLHKDATRRTETADRYAHLLKGRLFDEPVQEYAVDLSAVRSMLTPKMAEAVFMAGAGFSPTQAARAVGVSRDSMRGRLERAHAALSANTDTRRALAA